MSAPTKSHCTHQFIRTTPSLYAKEVGYEQRTSQQLLTAATGSRRRACPSDLEYLNAYPPPLILPDDELSHDPKYPPQSFTTWKNEKERNVVTEKRGVVYVAEYPVVDSKMAETITSWTVPKLESDTVSYLTH